MGSSFSARSPLEYLAVADQERIHTEMLRWVLGEHSPLDHTGRLALLELIVQRDLTDRRITRVTSGHKNIDLVVCLEGKTDDLVVAIENKLKSAEHSAQLQRYDEKLGEITTGEIMKIFLTLAGELATSSIDWQPVDYRLLLTAYERALEISPPLTYYDFLSDYCAILGRLTGAVDLVLTSPDTYARGVLFSGTMGDSAEVIEFDEYVRETRLKTILQKAWMKQLAVQTLEKFEASRIVWHVGETRGNGLVEFQVAERSVRQRVIVSLGVQVQNKALKVYARPEPYGHNATEIEHEVVRETLESLSAALGMSGARLSKPQGKGFSSFTQRGPTGTFEFDVWEQKLTPLLRGVVEAGRMMGARPITGLARPQLDARALARLAASTSDD